MSTSSLPPESKHSVQTPPDREVEVDPDTGDRTSRQIIRRDSLTGNPICVVERRRAAITDRLLFYSIKTLNPNGEVLSQTEKKYSKSGRILSILEKTPFSSSFQVFHQRTGIMIFLTEETIDPEAGNLLVEKRFDHETGELVGFWGTKYDPKTGKPTSALHETFNPETRQLTLREEYEYDLENQELKLVSRLIPSENGNNP